MNWNGNELDTVGKVSDALLDIARRDAQVEADRFMEQYRAENEHADANVGYLSGYYDPETMAKVQRMFGVVHPVFGAVLSKEEWLERLDQALNVVALRELLVQADSLLSLVVYRGAGAVDDEWKTEAKALIAKLRAAEKSAAEKSAALRTPPAPSDAIHFRWTEESGRTPGNPPTPRTPPAPTGEQ